MNLEVKGMKLVCSPRNSTGRKELKVEYRKCQQVRNGKLKRILPRGGTDQVRDDPIVCYHRKPRLKSGRITEK